MNLGIDGKVALVTGASKGLGLGVATTLASEGAKLAISSRSRERIDRAAEQIGASPFVHDARDIDATARSIRGEKCRGGVRSMASIKSIEMDVIARPAGFPTYAFRA